MAEAIAAEWEAQQGKVDPGTMPVTRAANSAIDKVTPQFDEVVGPARRLWRVRPSVLPRRSVPQS